MRFLINLFENFSFYISISPIIKAASSTEGPRTSAQLGLFSDRGSLASPAARHQRGRRSIPNVASRWRCEGHVMIFTHAEFWSGEKYSKFGRNPTFQMQAAFTCLLVGGAEIMSSVDCVNMSIINS
ncbi:hypothetical protein XENOCAPTIV_011661 [Xenoophorus captivus]|uniref:Uncharacterized protein n=1 Tax=Xenoophorus captivus TaxID=1517983 RepID=A0ABV0S777_9TELE